MAGEQNGCHPLCDGLFRGLCSIGDRLDDRGDAGVSAPGTGGADKRTNADLAAREAARARFAGASKARLAGKLSAGNVGATPSDIHNAVLYTQYTGIRHLA